MEEEEGEDNDCFEERPNDSFHGGGRGTVVLACSKRELLPRRRALPKPLGSSEERLEKDLLLCAISSPLFAEGP